MENKREYFLIASIDEEDVRRKFECGLVKLILTEAGKIENVNLSELNFDIIIYVNRHLRSDLEIHRISINHNEGCNSVIIKIDGCLGRIFDETFFNKEMETKRKIQTWYCPIERIKAIESVGEILDYFKSKKI